MSEKTIPLTSIENEKEVESRLLDFKERHRLRRMNKDDRYDFINWMFEHFHDIDSSQSRWKIAKDLTKLYKEEHPVQLNVDWVNALLRCQIIKYKDGTYGFESTDIPFTVDDMCTNASVYRCMKW